MGNCNVKGIAIISNPRTLEIEEEGSFKIRKAQLELKHTEKIIFNNLFPEEFSKTKCVATKMRDLATKVIAPVHRNKLAGILQHPSFTFYLDKTTGKMKGIEYMTLLTRYVDPETFESRVELLTL